MAYRILEVTLASAKDLKDVNVFSKMDVYAVATLSGDPRTKQRTPTDNNGGKDPSWNATLRFSIPADNAAAAGLVLHVLLRSERALGDRDIGEVHVPVKELIEGTPGQLVSYQVRNPQSGKAKGVLNLSFKFGQMPAAEKAPKPAPAADPFTAYPPPSKGSAEPVTAYPPPSKGSADPVTAYPAAASASATPYPPPGYAPPAGYGYGYPPAPQGGYGYPPPPQAGYGYPPPQQGGYGYPPPQQGGYGYPPPQAGYGYPPQMAQPGKKKNKFGMGLGAGLLGGALGGLLIGDMVSDADAYDAGYDDGFGDGMDF